MRSSGPLCDHLNVSQSSTGTSPVAITAEWNRLRLQSSLSGPISPLRFAASIANAFDVDVRDSETLLNMHFSSVRSSLSVSQRARVRGRCPRAQWYTWDGPTRAVPTLLPRAPSRGDAERVAAHTTMNGTVTELRKSKSLVGWFNLVRSRP
jgi:hypothetical protein